MYTQNGPFASQRGQYSGECWSVIKKKKREKKEKESLGKKKKGLSFPA